MNIFVLDKEANTSAKMLCDCHLRKMCVETAQILSAVMLRRGIPLRDGMPKPQNIKHPVIVAIDDPKSFNWVIYYFVCLNTEYCRRFNKLHKYANLQDAYFNALKASGAGLDCSTLAKCCGDLDVSNMDIVTAYRKYYTEVKKPQLAAKNLWKFTEREDWTE